MYGHGCTVHVQATWSSLARIAPLHRITTTKWHAYRAEGNHIQLVLDRHCRHFPIVRLNRSTGDEIDRDRHLVPFVHHRVESNALDLYSTTSSGRPTGSLSNVASALHTWWWSGDQLTDAYGRARARISSIDMGRLREGTDLMTQHSAWRVLSTWPSCGGGWEPGHATWPGDCLAAAAYKYSPPEKPPAISS